MSIERFIDTLHECDMHLWIDEEYHELLIEAIDIIACATISSSHGQLKYPFDREKFLIACALYLHSDSHDRRLSLLCWKRKQAQKHRAIVDIEKILNVVIEHSNFKKFIQSFSFENDINYLD